MIGQMSFHHYDRPLIQRGRARSTGRPRPWGLCPLGRVSDVQAACETYTDSVHQHFRSSQLRSIANLVMQDPRPAVVFYGPDLIMIYNEAEIELLGGFHPCMGVSARIALASVWSDYFEPIIERNLVGETVEKINTAIHMVRNGFMEGKFWLYVRM
jgi:hypothetical protein